VVTLEQAGNLASLLGLGVSLFVLWQVRDLRSFYKQKARVPILIEELSELLSSINELITTKQTDHANIEPVLGRVEGKILSLKKNFKPARAEIKKVESVLSYYRRGDKRIQDVYRSLNAALSAIKEQIKDRDWER